MCASVTPINMKPVTLLCCDECAMLFTSLSHLHIPANITGYDSYLAVFN